MEKLKDLQLLQTIAQDLIEDYNADNIMETDCTLKEAYYITKFLQKACFYTRDPKNKHFCIGTTNMRIGMQFDENFTQLKYIHFEHMETQNEYFCKEHEKIHY